MNNSEIVYTTLKDQGYKVFPLEAPNNEVLPFVIYHEVTSKREFCLTSIDDKVKSRFRVTCYASTFNEVQTMLDTLTPQIELVTHAIYNTTNRKMEDYFQGMIEFSVYI